MSSTASSSVVRDVTSFPINGDDGETTTNKKNAKSVLFFWAPWHEQCKPGGQMDAVFRSLAETSSSSSAAAASSSSPAAVDFCRVEAEAAPDVSRRFGVTIVPTFVLLDGDGAVVERVEGVEPARLTRAVRDLIALSSPEGNREVEKQQHQGGAGGGGEDTPPSKSSSLTPEEEEERRKRELDERLDRLVNSSEVVLFMKGDPTAPRCGFSRQVVALLEDAGIPFGTFDILDPDAQDVRQGLKAKFDWPTYPQVYVRGELMGGLDILKEMAEDESSGDLAAQLGVEARVGEVEAVESLDDRLAKLVRRSRVMLFMKGLPSAPRCGFSRKIVELLEDEGVAFDAFDILEDEEVRHGLKEFSDWPTYPQLYVEGDLLGGLDIVQEMAESGDLAVMLKGGD